VVGGLLLLLGYLGWSIYTVPDAATALDLSLKRARQPALAALLKLHPEYCSIKGTPGLGWQVACDGVPLTSTTGCSSFWWKVDRWGHPSGIADNKMDVLSGEEPCRRPQP
jgi:hypothetical protein